MSFNTLYIYEKYMIASNNSLFKDIVLPNSVTQGSTTYAVDKDILVETIIQTSEEFPVAYDNPDYLKWRIETWFKKNQYTFNKWWYAIHFDYEPLYNFDRYEESNDSMETTYSDLTSATGTAEDKVSTYPTNEYNPSAKNENTANNTNTGENSTESEHTGHLYGNIGVTTSQQMLASEIQLYEQFNFYQKIADIFVADFCCMVY